MDKLAAVHSHVTRLPLPEHTPSVEETAAKPTCGVYRHNDVSIPYVSHDARKYVSVKTIERRLLARFPAMTPEMTQETPPLPCRGMTSSERHTLVRLGRKCRDQSFVGDLVVDLHSALNFYHYVKECFPVFGDNAGAECMEGGWLVVDNTLVPYTHRILGPHTEKLTPLHVIQYGACVLTDLTFPPIYATADERRALTKMCNSAGIQFNFPEKTLLISLREFIHLARGSGIHIHHRGKRLKETNPKFGNPPTDLSSTVAHDNTRSVRDQQPTDLPHWSQDHPQAVPCMESADRALDLSIKRLRANEVGDWSSIPIFPEPQIVVKVPQDGVLHSSTDGRTYFPKAELCH